MEKTFASNKPATPAATPAANKPAHTIRLGAIKAAIWENTIGENTRYSVSLCRLYKDGEQWKITESFGRDDLLLVAKVADQAHTWICDQLRPPERS
jgi:hypothetical protein